MTIFQVFILALLEGLTEFLPISSTGHLLLAQKYLSIPSTDFTKSFDIIIQLAAILAVIWFYKDKILKNKFLWRSILMAFLPTGFIGFVFYKLIRDSFLTNIMFVPLSLFVGGIALLIIDRLPQTKRGHINLSKLSFLQLTNIGLFQSLSIIPGVSRSAASIIGGLFSGLSRTSAVEFSFLLAIPTMIMASGYDLLKSGLQFNSSEYYLLGLGCLIAFLSALASIKFFLSFLGKHNFTLFALYRIILAIVVLFTLRFFS